MTASVIATSSEGGVLYSNINTATLSVSIISANLLGVLANSLGSIISLRKGVTAPVLSQTITSSYIQCQTNDIEKTHTMFGAIMTNLGLSTPVASSGGAFFFEGVGTGSSVTSSSN